MNYYFLDRVDGNGVVATASTKLQLYEFNFAQLSECKELPFSFKVDSSDKGEIQDLMADDLGINLFSDKLKKILDVFNEKSKVFDWVVATVKIRNSKVLYYVPRFYREPDVIDKDKTSYAGGDFIVKPCFSKIKVNQLENANFFYFSRMPFNCGIGGLMVVNDVIKKKMKSDGITGVSLSKAKIE